MTTTFQYSVRDRSGSLSERQARGRLAGASSRPSSRRWATRPISINEANTGHEQGAQAPEARSQGQAQGPGDLLPAVRDDDQLWSVAAARAEHPRRADREQGARSGCSPMVRTDVETGSALSQALAKHSPDIFPPLMVNMTKAGEVGGFLDSVLLQIAENFEAEVKLRGKVKSAMTYPGRGVHHGDPHVLGDAALHRPEVRQDVQGPRRRAAGADRILMDDEHDHEVWSARSSSSA